MWHLAVAAQSKGPKESGSSLKARQEANAAIMREKKYVGLLS